MSMACMTGGKTLRSSSAICNGPFIDKKPAYYDFANSTNTLTEAQVFEKYAP